MKRSVKQLLCEQKGCGAYKYVCIQSVACMYLFMHQELKWIAFFFFLILQFQSSKFEGLLTAILGYVIIAFSLILCHVSFTSIYDNIMSELLPAGRLKLLCFLYTAVPWILFSHQNTWKLYIIDCIHALL